jgi:RNA polymerase sigma-70 factor (ECF subfamily)
VTLSLEVLVQRAQDGDLAAFDAIYAATSARLYAVCLRLCGDRQEAASMMQDAYVHAWQRLSAFRGDSLFTSWLHRIAVNAVLMERRGRGRREARVMPADDTILELAAARTPSTELGIDLERAIASLPEGARTALVLHDIEGYTHAEIADMLGVATGTVKAQLHRARRLLQNWLER